MTREQLEARRAELLADLEKVRVKAAQIQGAVAMIDEMLATMPDKEG